VFVFVVVVFMVMSPVFVAVLRFGAFALENSVAEHGP